MVRMKWALMTLLVWGLAYAEPDAGPMQATPRAPFGFDLMKPLSKAKAKKYRCFEGRHGYICKTAPKPYPLFDDYFLEVLEGKIYSVTGSGEMYDGPDGKKIQAKFAEVLSLLTEKYGQPVIKDWIDPGSKWKGPDNWLKALEEGERVLAAGWGINFVTNWHYQFSAPVGIYLSASTLTTGKATIRAVYTHGETALKAKAVRNPDPHEGRGTTDGL